MGGSKAAWDFMVAVMLVSVGCFSPSYDPKTPHALRSASCSGAPGKALVVLAPQHAGVQHVGVLHKLAQPLALVLLGLLAQLAVVPNR